jgi:protocatechuate 3,4-dioxygenase beta subunit
MLALIAGTGVATLVGCGSSDSDASSSTTAAGAATSTTAAASGATSSGATDAIPEETAGPYPGDGTNGVNVLTESGIVRSDLRSSFGAFSGTAAGIDTTVRLRILDAATGSALAGAAVYLWHADQDGLYSLYTKADQNYLRGVQEAGSDGTVTFLTAFPGAYDGRWPHLHFEVYPTLAEATAAGTPVSTSQLAIPEDTCDLVYETAGYEQSVSNMTRTTLDSDMVFSDGVDQQLAAVTGSVSEGFTLTLDVPV